MNTFESKATGPVSFSKQQIWSSVFPRISLSSFRVFRAFRGHPSDSSDALCIAAPSPFRRHVNVRQIDSP
jgi:hypothetical protein